MIIQVKEWADAISLPEKKSADSLTDIDIHEPQRMNRVA